MALATTSREAYEHNKSKAPVQRAAIVNYIRSQGVHGATCDEAEVVLNLPHQTCSARFTDLKDEKKIVPSGEVRMTRTNSRAMVLVTPEFA